MPRSTSSRRLSANCLGSQTALHGRGDLPIAIDVEPPLLAVAGDVVDLVDDEPPQAPPVVGDQGAEVLALSVELGGLKKSLADLRHVVQTPSEVLVHRKRSTAVHQGATDEKLHPPTEWRTKCGWMYGFANFYRVSNVQNPFRHCRKCFRELHLSDDSGSGTDTDQASSSDSSSSA